MYERAAGAVWKLGDLIQDNHILKNRFIWHKRTVSPIEDTEDAEASKF